MCLSSLGLRSSVGTTQSKLKKYESFVLPPLDSCRALSASPFFPLGTRKEDNSSISPGFSMEETVKLTKEAVERGISPTAWFLKVSSILSSSDVEIPSCELAEFLVNLVCGDCNVPMAWKYLEKAVELGIVSPALVVALLAVRVISRRHTRPAAYRLYLEILKGYFFTFKTQVSSSICKRTLILVDDVLHLSQMFNTQGREPVVIEVELVFWTIWKLLDASLDDESLLELAPNKMFRWHDKAQIKVDDTDSFHVDRNEFSDKLRKANTLMAIELIWWCFHQEVFSRLLSLVKLNMYSYWLGFCERLHLLATKSLLLRDSNVSPTILLQFALDGQRKIGQCYNTGKYNGLCAISSGHLVSPGGNIHGMSHSALWIPLDLYFEDVISRPIIATNAIKDLTGLVKALQAVHRTTWHDALSCLWMSSLRLVQRERDPIESPIPHIDARMSILLCITTLAVAEILGEEEIASAGNDIKQLEGKVAPGSRHKAFLSSLQKLGDYDGLLSPPMPIVSAANMAATKATMFVAGLTLSNAYIENNSLNEKMTRCSGNLRHLIVEACLARNLLDSLAYFWPGYVSGCVSQISCPVPGQASGWTALLEDAPLTRTLINTLMNTPASSLAELEKIYKIAVNGSIDEKISAASILCGASLIRGWNVQEHTVRFIVKLLSPSHDDGGDCHHLIVNAPVLDVVLTGISSLDCVQIFSFHGLVPELAGSLMPICEIFGSSTPNMSWTLPTGEEISAHAVFSDAFTLLLRLWRFNHLPAEFCVKGDGAPSGTQLTPEYLLFLRNLQVISQLGVTKDRNGVNDGLTDTSTRLPIFVDSFPKLKAWYQQHQACIASTLSGLINKTSVHENVNVLLTMMFGKINKRVSQSISSGTSSSGSLSNSSEPVSEDGLSRPLLPAWDILEAVPFVVDAALTACSHGRLSTHDFATGLRDLVDFLPASLAPIVGYFSAEVTRGIWKPVYMNGTDWPSPAANLSIFEEKIKKILAGTGAYVPSLDLGSSPAALPLPLAAFVSLTITYKLDKPSEKLLNLAGPALGSLAASCPWPSLPIVAALWGQKVKRWSDYFIFSASSTVFHHNNDAVVQLLKSCFSALLGFPPNDNGGIGSLLGHGFESDCSGGLSPVSPGILYLEIHRDIKDMILLAEEILSLLMLSIQEIAGMVPPTKPCKRFRDSNPRMASGQVSLVSALTKVKLAASLGATLIWLSGGSGLVRYLFRELLPSRFLSGHKADQGKEGGVMAMLEGHGLAYFAMLCGTFAWGTDSALVTSKRRPKVLRSHLEFLVDAMEGKFSLSCSMGTWKAYVSLLLGLIVDCTPNWVAEMELDILKRLSGCLRHWNEEELAFLLLTKGGTPAMGAAADFIFARK